MLLFSKEFCQLSEYSRFYKNILAIFATGISYELDMFVTDSIEKYIWNLPLDVDMSSISNFRSISERNEFYKEMTRKSILEL